MYKFLNTDNPPKLNQEDINNLNRSLINNEILIKTSQKKVWMVLGELTPILLNFLHKIQKEGILPNLLIPKPGTDT
jgi:hypothetical protein